MNEPKPTNPGPILLAVFGGLIAGVLSWLPLALIFIAGMSVMGSRSGLVAVALMVTLAFAAGAYAIFRRTLATAWRVFFIVFAVVLGGALVACDGYWVVMGASG